MAYVFDTSSFSVIGNYYPQQFPTFWENFNQAVIVRDIISVREVYRELEFYTRHSDLSDWVEDHRDIFLFPSSEEIQFVQEIFSVPHFRMLISEQDLLAGNLRADPFIIAKAQFLNGCVVTEETHTPNAARIPNVCEHFGIDCTNLQGFMERERWTF